MTQRQPTSLRQSVSPLDVLILANELNLMVEDLQDLHGYSRTLAIKTVLDLFRSLLTKAVKNEQ